MTVTATTLIATKYANNTQTTEYTSTNITTIIDKFTATNGNAAAQTVSVNLVNPLGTAGAENIVTKLKSLQPNESYTFPEIVGHVLTNGAFISVVASAASAIVIRSSGRQIT